MMPTAAPGESPQFQFPAATFPAQVFNLEGVLGMPSRAASNRMQVSWRDTPCSNRYRKTRQFKKKFRPAGAKSPAPPTTASRADEVIEPILRNAQLTW